MLANENGATVRRVARLDRGSSAGCGRRLLGRAAARRHGAAAADRLIGLGTRRDGLGFFSFTGSSRTIWENGGTLRPAAVILRKAQLKTESLRSPVIFPEYFAPPNCKILVRTLGV